MKRVTINYDISDEFIPPLNPSKSLVPKWYKNSTQFIGGKINFLPKFNATVKHCAPFLDSLTTGYMITLWADVLVTQENGNPSFSWKDNMFSVVQVRDTDAIKTIPVPDGYYPGHFSWVEPYSLEVPSGYSYLITHPLNRFDLPFLTFSGIVDGGWAMPTGNIPFFLKQGYEGLIEQGTPIAQIIPFKQSSWKLEKKEGLYKESQINFNKSKLTVQGIYKKLFWTKKEFN